MKIYTTCLTILVTICLSIAPFQFIHGQNNGSRYAPNSKLSSGKWIKLKVTKNAIYKLTYDDIKKMGISDPAKVKVYGYGGWILDEDFSKKYVDDLPEVSVWLNKGTDGVFGSGDYLLFYGRGPLKWSGSDHENNPYSNYGAYFLTESDSGPKEMSIQASVKTTDVTFNTFDDYLLNEKDSITITNTGRELFGESFLERSFRDFNFSVPGIASTTGEAYLSFVARPSEVTPVTLSVNGTEALNLSVGVTSDSYWKAYLTEGSGTWTAESGSTNLKATINYNSKNQTIAYLNYLKIGVNRYLQPYEGGTLFRRSTLSSPGVRNAQYKVSNATDKCLVFDVTDNFDTRQVETSLSGSELTFGVSLPTNKDSVREYALVDLTKSFDIPQSLGEVQNQNLHSLPQTEMVILAPQVFLNQANALAEEHRKRDGLSVTVVQADLIFNEFSSGVPDATAYRRFMKMFYDRATTEAEKPKYLLLFGDGIFDNRFATSQVAKLDPKYYLLTYQVKESLDERSSFGTDDYFGFLEDSEGVHIGWDSVDLGIGRFPVHSLEQANNAVAKIIAYMNNKQYGDWKNRLIFTADDTDYLTPGYNYCTHAWQADTLANYVERVHPDYMVTRSYMDAFKPVIQNGKKTYPDAKNRLMETLKEGSFLLNYTGHGSTTAWSAEDMLNIADIRQMTFKNLPLWITATCDFGWFDGVTTSGGEEAFLNKTSGGIALFTTSRVVFSPDNYSLNKLLIQYLFAKKDGKYQRLGDVLRLSKNGLDGGDTNKLNYVLLGDPALKLNYPEYNIRLESINGKPVQAGEVLQFKALDKVTLSGKIVNENGTVSTGFNGNMRVSVFDSKQELKSIVANDLGNYFTFTDYVNTVATPNTTVKDGSFTIDFTVPLDISYSNNNGKISLYASDETSGIEAQGYYQNYFLNGTNPKPETNESGPEVLAMYLNSPSFKEGDSVNETPYFVAQVRDTDGINMTGSGLGHDITICIDNSPAMTYYLNNYYEPTSDTEGEVKYSIPALPAGKHTLVFRIWDILNNPTVDSLEFNVVAGMKPQLYDITAGANPAKVETYFLLQHDRPDTKIEVEIQVYDLSGRPVWKHVESGSSEWLKYYPIRWNLETDGGRRANPGMYIYRATIRTANSKEATKSKKIIVLGQ